MKTIQTTLPVYDRLAKQHYEKCKYGKVDLLSPVKTPLHRLPSMQWNVEADDPGEISDIQFYDEHGVLQYTKDSGFYGWMNYLGRYDVFTTSGLNISVATQNDAVIAYAIAYNVHTPDTGAIGSGSYMAKAGEIINIKGSYISNSGAANRLCIFNDLTFTEIAGQALATGAIDYSYTFLADAEILVLIYQPLGGATSYSFTDVEIGISNGISFFSTTASYIQVSGGGAWTGVGWDTFTPNLATTAITQALKTTAAGEDYCQNVVAAGSCPATLAVGEVIRIIVDLAMTSGDEPKIELRNTATGAAVSNTVQLVDGVNYVFLVATAALASGWAITLYNSDTETCNWAATFVDGTKTVIPRLYTTISDDYFQYKGETLGTLLPEGIYYLKFTTENDYIYYSDYFEVTCVYPNLISSLTNNAYETFSASGTTILSAINTAATAQAYSDVFNVINGETITVIFNLTLNSGALPTVYITDAGWGTAVLQGAVIGLNVISLTTTWSGDAIFRLYNTTNTNYRTSEIIVIRSYSEKYTRINFSNTCDLGDILYADDFEQSLWVESEPMEYTFPLDEEGAKNGYARFIRSSARQDKKHLLRTKEMPDYMADVMYRMMLHDTVELIDRVGNEYTVKALEVEHEYLWDDKYYVKFDVTLDFDEAVIIGGCCNNMT